MSSHAHHTVRQPAQPGRGSGPIPTLELLLDVHRVGTDHGPNLSTSEYDEHGRYCYATIVDRDEFDTWEDILWAAGLEIIDDRIPIKELRDEILKLSVRLDRTPTTVDMNDEGKYSVQAYRKREEFDYSWNGALKYAGLEPNRRTGKKDPSATGTGTRYSVVRKNATKISTAPNPMGDDPWFYLKETDITQSILHGLLSFKGVESRDTSIGTKWKLQGNVYEVAVENAENRATFECGCTGITNVPGGGIECADCGIQYPRETVKEVLSAQ